MLESLLTATAIQRVLTFLAEHPSQAYFEKQIATANGLSIGATHQAVHPLADAGLLHGERKGRMCFYTANLSHPMVRQWKVQLTVAKLEPLLRELRGIAQHIVLFGSCAAGANREDSDIDLYVLTKETAAVQSAVAQSPLDSKVQLVAKTLMQDVELQRVNPIFYEQVQRGLVLWEASSEHRV